MDEFAFNSHSCAFNPITIVHEPIIWWTVVVNLFLIYLLYSFISFKSTLKDSLSGFWGSRLACSSNVNKQYSVRDCLCMPEGCFVYVRILQMVPKWLSGGMGYDVVNGWGWGRVGRGTWGYLNHIKYKHQ